MEMTQKERLCKFIKKCQRNFCKPDLHTFWIDASCGRQYVECKQHTVKIYGYDEYGEERRVTFFDGAEEAAEYLFEIGSIFNTIDM